MFARIILIRVLVATWILTPCIAAEAIEFDWMSLQLRITHLLQQGLATEAEHLLEQNVEAARLRGDTGAQFAEALNGLGTLYHDSGQFFKAERAYNESLRHWSRLREPDPRIAFTLINVGDRRLDRGRTSEAEKLYEQARRILVSGYGTDSPEMATALSRLAFLYCETQRYEEARQTAEQAVAILEVAGDDAQRGSALFLLARVAWKQGRNADAEGLLRSVIEIWGKSLGRKHPTYASGLVSLAVLISKKQPVEADQLFREALRIIEGQFGPDHLFAGCVLLLYARHLEDLGRRGDSRRLKRLGDAILARHSRENFMGHTVSMEAFQHPGRRP